MARVSRRSAISMVFVWQSSTHRQTPTVHWASSGPTVGLILTRAWRRQKPGLAACAPAAMSLGFFTSRAPLLAKQKWLCTPRPVTVWVIASPVNSGWTLSRGSSIGIFPIWVGAKPHGPAFLALGTWVLAFSH